MRVFSRERRGGHTHKNKIPHKQWNDDSAFPKRKLYLNVVEPAPEGVPIWNISRRLNVVK